MPNYTIYSKPNCPWCDKAKELAEQKGLTYKVINLGDTPNVRDWLIDQGHRTVPQVYAGLRHIGGYEAFEAHLKEAEDA